jgi:hypothetical protein
MLWTTLSNYASFVRSCRPLTVISGSSHEGFRIGGAPPKGVLPKRTNAFTRYFATIPLGGVLDQDLSLFVSLSDDYEDPAFLASNMCVMHSTKSTLVQFVVHPATRRAKRSRFRSGLSEAALRLESERPDNPRPESDQLWIQHKIGVFPFFYHPRPEIISSADRLMAEGFIHLLQMSSLGGNDALIEGEWPFGNTMFHVFAKESARGLDFRYIWA